MLSPHHCYWQSSACLVTAQLHIMRHVHSFHSRRRARFSPRTTRPPIGLSIARRTNAGGNFLHIPYVVTLMAQRMIFTALHPSVVICCAAAIQMKRFYRSMRLVECAVLPPFFYCPRGSDGLYCFHPSFFSVSTITHEPLHAA